MATSIEAQPTRRTQVVSTSEVRGRTPLPGDGHVVQSPPIAVTAGGETDLVERPVRHDAEEAVVAAAGVGEDLGEIVRVPKDVQRRVVAILPAVGRKILPVHRVHVCRPREDRRVEPQLERRGLLRARLVAQLDAFDLLVVLPVRRAGARRADEDTRGVLQLRGVAGLRGYPAGLREEDAEVPDRRFLTLGNVDVDAVE